MIYGLGGLCAAAKVTQRQADHWVRLGYLRPTEVAGRPGAGTGNHRIFDEDEVAIAAILGRLSSPQARADLAREVIKRGSVDLGPAFVESYLRDSEAAS